MWRRKTSRLAGAVGVAPEGDRLVAGDEGRAVLLSMDDGSELGTLPHVGHTLFARFGPDGFGSELHVLAPS